MKTISVELKFGSHADLLWETSMKNFISEQPTRFELMEGVECLTGTMYWCERYLEAVFTMALCDGVALYYDNTDSDDFGHYVVISKKLFGRKAKYKREVKK